MPKLLPPKLKPVYTLPLAPTLEPREGTPRVVTTQILPGAIIDLVGTVAEHAVTICYVTDDPNFFVSITAGVGVDSRNRFLSQGKQLREPLRLKLARSAPFSLLNTYASPFQLNYLIGRAPHSNRMRVESKRGRRFRDANAGQTVFPKFDITSYFPNQPIGLPERSTQTLFTCVYISSACLPISRP